MKLRHQNHSKKLSIPVLLLFMMSMLAIVVVEAPAIPVAKADTIVGPSIVYNHAPNYDYLRNAAACYAQGHDWFFFIGASPNYYIFYNSSSDAIHWTTGTQIGSISTMSDIAASCVGSTVYLAYDSDNNNAISPYTFYFAKGTLNNDGTITWAIIDDALSAGAPFGGAAIVASIAGDLSASNQAWVVLAKDGGFSTIEFGRIVTGFFLNTRLIASQSSFVNDIASLQDGGASLVYVDGAIATHLDILTCDVNARCLQGPPLTLPAGAAVSLGVTAIGVQTEVAFRNTVGGIYSAYFVNYASGSWSPIKEVVAGSASHRVYTGGIASQGNTLAYFWVNYTTHAGYYCKSLDGGNTWNNCYTNVFPYVSHRGIFTSPQAIGNSIAVIMSDNNPTYYARITFPPVNPSPPVLPLGAQLIVDGTNSSAVNTFNRNDTQIVLDDTSPTSTGYSWATRPYFADGLYWAFGAYVAYGGSGAGTYTYWSSVTGAPKTWISHQMSTSAPPVNYINGYMAVWASGNTVYRVISDTSDSNIYYDTGTFGSHGIITWATENYFTDNGGGATSSRLSTTVDTNGNWWIGINYVGGTGEDVYECAHPSATCLSTPADWTQSHLVGGAVMGVVVAGASGHVFLVTSTNTSPATLTIDEYSGSTWSAGVATTTNTYVLHQSGITTNGDTLYLAGVSGTTLYLAQFTYGGSWTETSEATGVNTSPTGISADSSNHIVMYYVPDATADNLYYIWSSNSGSTFSSPIPVAVGQTMPIVNINAAYTTGTNGKTFVTWTENTGYEIGFLAVSFGSRGPLPVRGFSSGFTNVINLHIADSNDLLYVLTLVQNQCPPSNCWGHVNPPITDNTGLTWHMRDNVTCAPSVCYGGMSNLGITSFYATASHPGTYTLTIHTADVVGILAMGIHGANLTSPFDSNLANENYTINPLGQCDPAQPHIRMCTGVNSVNNGRANVTTTTNNAYDMVMTIGLTDAAGSSLDTLVTPTISHSSMVLSVGYTVETSTLANVPIYGFKSSSAAPWLILNEAIRGIVGPEYGKIGITSVTTSPCYGFTCNLNIKHTYPNELLYVFTTGSSISTDNESHIWTQRFSVTAGSTTFHGFYAITGNPGTDAIVITGSLYARALSIVNINTTHPFDPRWTSAFTGVFNATNPLGQCQSVSGTERGCYGSLRGFNESNGQNPMMNVTTSNPTDLILGFSNANGGAIESAYTTTAGGFMSGQSGFVLPDIFFGGSYGGATVLAANVTTGTLSNFKMYTNYAPDPKSFMIGDALQQVDAQAAVSIDTVPTGNPFLINGSVYTSPYVFVYHVGSFYNVTAYPTLEGGTYTFQNWEAFTSSSHTNSSGRTFIFGPSDTNVLRLVANYKLTYTITLTATTTTPTVGTTTTLTAVVHGTGDVSSISSFISIYDVTNGTIVCSASSGDICTTAPIISLHVHSETFIAALAGFHYTPPFIAKSSTLQIKWLGSGHGMCFSYVLIGGGNFSAPVFTYTDWNGGSPTTKQMTIQHSLTCVYQIDSTSGPKNGTRWSVTNPLGGSSAYERALATNSTSNPISGTVTGHFTLIQLTYRHQYDVPFSFKVIDNTPYSGAPYFTGYVNGSSTGHITLTTSPIRHWLDAGNLWVAQNPWISVSTIFIPQNAAGIIFTQATVTNTSPVVLYYAVESACVGTNPLILLERGCLVGAVYFSYANLIGGFFAALVPLVLCMAIYIKTENGVLSVFLFLISDIILGALFPPIFASLLLVAVALVITWVIYEMIRTQQ